MLSNMTEPKVTDESQRMWDRLEILSDKALSDTKTTILKEGRKRSGWLVLAEPKLGGPGACRRHEEDPIDFYHSSS